MPEPEALTKVINALKATNKGLSEKRKIDIAKFTDLEALDPVEGDKESDDWLFNTIESLKMYKAPGPDGLPNDFYYIFRHNKNMKTLLRQVFKDSLKRGCLPDSMRITYYKLLYKKGFYSDQELESGILDGSSKDPRNLGNWRPIALLPCDSKILSAYFANKLKTCLDDLISKSQSAFIPGRSIHDNIMLIQQMIHYHNETNTKGGMVFVDFSHAYDYISQEYIIAVMETMNFPPNFIGVIKTLMANQTGRVLVNGDLSPEFQVNNGGKQGDPLFPLIYIIALEGMIALLETDQNYKGITPPSSDKRLSQSGFADDTCIFVSEKMEDRIAIEQMLGCFQLASGNEVKAAKSYIIWLGPWKDSTDKIFNIKPLVGSERYLGLQIAANFDSSLNWYNIIDRLPASYEYWSTLGLSIFGRTLMINSSLLSKLWFVAMHTPHTTEIVKSIDKQVNNYFRKGKKFTSISKKKRITPTYYGGLGQIDVQTQLDNLLAKWAIRSLANDPHPWNLYWRWNIIQLQIHLKTHTHPTLYKCDWNRKRSPGYLFHMIIPVYKAWHRINLQIKFDFMSVSAMPLFHNKFITENTKSIQIPRNGNRILNLLNETNQVLLIKDLYTKKPVNPDNQFDYLDTATHCMTKNTPECMNDKFKMNMNLTCWDNIVLKIPTFVDKIMTAGESDSSLEGWYATEDSIIDVNQITDDPVGDIYYKYVDKEGNITLYHYIQVNETHLEIDSSSNDLSERWLEWRTSILPYLRALKVSCVSGLPVRIGWANAIISLADFLIPIKEERKMRSTVEQAIATSNYSNIRNKPTIRYKPLFNNLFRSIRKFNSKPLEQLENWPPSQGEIEKHGKKLGPVFINWTLRLKKLRNCTFIGPKYRQLIYQITTDSVVDGLRLSFTELERGLCPHCDKVADIHHMLITCEHIQSIWIVIDKLGSTHWDEYFPLQYEQIPVILESYEPINLFHVSAIWAIWVTWCKFFYDPDPVGDWGVHILSKFKEQLHKRVAEAPGMTQWLKLAQDRRTVLEEGTEQSINTIPEKEFLLIHSQSIKTNSMHLICTGGELDPNIEKWIGNGHLLVLDYDSLNGNKPRFRLKKEPWIYLVPPEVPECPSANGWKAYLPLSVVDT